MFYRYELEHKNVKLRVTDMEWFDLQLSILLVVGQFSFFIYLARSA